MGIADRPDPFVALEMLQVLEELGFELTLADPVDLTREFLAIHDREPAEFSPEMGMVIRAIEKRIGTMRFGNDPVNSAHRFSGLPWLVLRTAQKPSRNALSPTSR